MIAADDAEDTKIISQHSTSVGDFSPIAKLSKNPRLIEPFFPQRFTPLIL